jgi:hypothetical protein
MSRYSRADIAAIASEFTGLSVPEEWTGLDAVLPLLERMRNDGAIVLVKWDGERRPEAGELPYTAVVQGGPLGDQPYRTDATSLEEALCAIVGDYAERVWRA